MSSIKLYNTLTHHKDSFVPLDEKSVRMYVCGPTVYGDPHIGNARPAIVFDLLFRVLRKKYGEENIVYVRNITDVDDKINKEIKQQNVSLKDLTENITARYHDSLDRLNVLSPTIEPKVTDHIQDIIKLISDIIDNGFAYEKGGHVFFDVSKYEKYGVLSKQDLSELRKGVRIEVSDDKKDAFDFVLWKPADGESPWWDSPWGKGRPGWHIECSAMSRKYLGKTFDIHAGGLDLIFPHHENEIAQSVCGNNAPFVRFWLHNGLIKIKGEKMSKSLKNIVTINSLLDEWDGNVLRFSMLLSHYRSIINWTDELLINSSERLKKWSLSVKDINTNSEPDDIFYEYLFDDLNTPKAIAYLSSLNKQAEKGDKLAAQKLRVGAMFLGIKLDYTGKKSSLELIAKDEIDRLIELRTQHKNKKDYKEADKIRNELEKKGVILNDTETGTYWSYTN